MENFYKTYTHLNELPEQKIFELKTKGFKLEKDDVRQEAEEQVLRKLKGQ